jgi:predicted nucleic acid-binding protein
MKQVIVVDTNILFAAMRNNSIKIRAILSNPNFHFVAPNFLVVEIFKHKERILQKATGTEEEVIELLILLIQQVKFISESQIPTETIIHAFRLCKDEDEKDTLFVALALEYNALFWTRDEKLKRHLKTQGFDTFFEE